MAQETPPLPRLTTEITALPKLSLKEEMHLVLGSGVNLLNRILYSEWAFFEPDDYRILGDVPQQLYAPYVWKFDELYEDTEKVEIFRAALGTETTEEAVTRASTAAQTIEKVIASGRDNVTPEAFYDARDVVKQMWRATGPTEFRDSTLA